MPITTTLLLAAAVLAGGAPADGPPPVAPITLDAEQSAALCADRIPALLARIERLTERVGGDAAVPGSTARLAQRLDRARDAGRDDLVALLERRLERRTELAGRLPEAAARVTAFRDAHCPA